MLVLVHLGRALSPHLTDTVDVLPLIFKFHNYDETEFGFEKKLEISQTFGSHIMSSCHLFYGSCAQIFKRSIFVHKIKLIFKKTTHFYLFHSVWRICYLTYKNN